MAFRGFLEHLVRGTGEKSPVSRPNRLVNAFFFALQDYGGVSRENKLIGADLTPDEEPSHDERSSHEDE